MSYIRPQAVIVHHLGYKPEIIEVVRSKADSLGMRPTEIVGSHVNGSLTFMCPPDGSKEGWEESDDGDERRTTLIAYMEMFRYEDGSSPLRWVEVTIDSDDHVSEVTAHSGEPAYNGETELQEVDGGR